jgi:bifunctional DNA-binding transcriptional regulator/antitoxin component of YhaV-PrlF toxin-antitoxin module
METAKVSSKHQIAILQKIRRYLGIEKNDVVAFVLKNRKFVLKSLEELLNNHIGTVSSKQVF